MRGYVAMLVVDKAYRGKGAGEGRRLFGPHWDNHAALLSFLSRA